MVVVDFGGGLAGVGLQDPAGGLDEAAFLGDGGGEEERVQGRAVKTFSDVGAGRDDDERTAVRVWSQAGLGRGAGLGVEAAAQDDRVVAVLP